MGAKMIRDPHPPDDYAMSVIGLGLAAVSGAVVALLVCWWLT